MDRAGKEGRGGIPFLGRSLLLEFCALRLLISVQEGAAWAFPG